jgi:hypothetical protein
VTGADELEPEAVVVVASWTSAVDLYFGVWTVA